MKLKKIVSLALAGILAVSMLTACGDNSSNNGGASSGDTTPSSSYTETVLKATNAATQTKLSASTNDKLDKAVAWAAQMDRSNSIGSSYTSLANITDSNWNIVKKAQEYMGGSGLQNYGSDQGWDFSAEKAVTWNNNNPSFPITYWTMYCVSRTASDEYITNEMAEKLDTWAKTMENKGEEAKGATWDYTVSVSKADCAGEDLADKSDDYVIIGVAITTNKTTVKY